MRLHIGCGLRFIPGFIHVDAKPYDHVDMVCQAGNLEWISSNTVEMVYSSHVLEHFGRHEVLPVLIEWARVLKPGGLLRLSVPNFAACAELYHERKLTAGIDEIMGLVVGGQKDEFDFHKMIFDLKSLESLLYKAGFTSIKEWDWRETVHSHIDDYSQAYIPHLNKSSGKLMSLNIEAVKKY